jgi:Carboxypeptidase regulatory-like domain
MVLKRSAVLNLTSNPTSILSLALVLGLAVGAAAPAVLAATETAPQPGEVTLALADYLKLVAEAEAAERARVERTAGRSAPLAEVVSQRTTARIDGGEAQVTTELEVLVQGSPRPVRLPLAGYPATAEIRRHGQPVPGASLTALPAGDAPAASAGPGAGKATGGVLLVAPEEGRYQVTIRGRAPLDEAGGVSRLAFPPVAAPVAVTELDLPAGAAWSAPGGVVVEESELGARRTVRLAGRRGETQVLELRRRFDNAEAEKLLVQTAVLTLVQLRPDGLRRHDVVFYEVARGGLGSFTVQLPPGLEVEQAGTDEGAAVPVVEGGRLTVHRQRRLQGTGYLVLSSAPAGLPGHEPGGAPLAPPLPWFEGPESGHELRARYLAVASSISATARPLPESAWVRVDLDDLPAALREALEVADLAAAWRWNGSGSGGSAQGAAIATGTGLAELEVAALPAAPTVPAPIERRVTTTLLTVDGTLLHRDLFTVAPAERAAAALDLTLPAGAVLWSARVGGQPVRPLDRGDRGGRVAVPLGPGGAGTVEVEVVSVQERAIPAGRSLLGLDLPEVARPVREHVWRLLLPENARYRYRTGDLQPAGGGAALAPARLAAAGLRQGPGGSGTLSGRVTDDSGQPLPGVTVTLESPAVAGRLVQVTDAHGRYGFRGLPPGRYVVKAELEGFSEVEMLGVQVAEGGHPEVPLSLSSGLAEAITVTSEAPLLDRLRPRRKAPVPPPPPISFDSFEELKKGLQSGIRPLPIEIPESGKALLLSGVLPPAHVAVELEVRARR